MAARSFDPEGKKIGVRSALLRDRPPTGQSRSRLRWPHPPATGFAVRIHDEQPCLVLRSSNFGVHGFLLQLADHPGAQAERPVRAGRCADDGRRGQRVMGRLSGPREAMARPGWGISRGHRAPLWRTATRGIQSGRWPRRGDGVIPRPSASRGRSTRRPSGARSGLVGDRPVSKVQLVSVYHSGSPTYQMRVRVYGDLSSSVGRDRSPGLRVTGLPTRCRLHSLLTQRRHCCNTPTFRME